MILHAYIVPCNGYKLMVDLPSSKRKVSIRIRLAVYYLLIIRVSNLIGKGLSCRESRCRIVADLIRTIFKEELP